MKGVKRPFTIWMIATFSGLVTLAMAQNIAESLVFGLQNSEFGGAFNSLVIWTSLPIFIAGAVLVVSLLTLSRHAVWAQSALIAATFLPAFGIFLLMNSDRAYHDTYYLTFRPIYAGLWLTVLLLILLHLIRLRRIGVLT